MRNPKRRRQGSDASTPAAVCPAARAEGGAGDVVGPSMSAQHGCEKSEPLERSLGKEEAFRPVRMCCWSGVSRAIPRRCWRRCTRPTLVHVKDAGLADVLLLDSA